MARAHFVKSSRKEHVCGRGHTIPAGDGYYWAAPGFRASKYGKKYRCLNHPFRESELTNSIRSEALAAVEAFEDGLDGIQSFDDLESLRADLESALDDYVSTREEALEQWPNGNSQLEDYVQQAETARDEVAGWSSNYSDTDEPDEEILDDLHHTAKEAGEQHDRDSLVEIWLQERLDEDKNELSDIVGGLDL